MPETDRPILACFAFERGDARVRKRVAALQDQGWKVRGYMFHRIRDKVDEPPFWENVDLGITENRRYLQRAKALLSSLRLLWQNRSGLREATVFYAVNADNALLALAARWMARRPGGPAPVVLELADVQSVMLQAGPRGILMRVVERFVLRRIALLITTSPGFVKNYFAPVQGFTGPVFLLENKVYPSEGLARSVDSRSPDASLPQPVHGGRPWVIGYFGAIRCERSLALIGALARRFPDRLRFYLRGYASSLGDAAVTVLKTGLPNQEFAGAYDYPGDLPAMYGQIDFNWTFDFSSPSGNSAWLLPNRIYEGGLFACPALADAGTETGIWVKNHHAGWTFDEPLEESLTEFFQSLTPALWQEGKAAALRLPLTVSCGEDDYRELSATLRRLSAHATP